MKSDFRDLDVWKKGKELRIFVFNLVKKFPEEERYRLSDQMIRASRTITANIAEGYGRYHSTNQPLTKEFISKTTFTVIPACLESFSLVGNLKKDAGQASMTEILTGM